MEERIKYHLNDTFDLTDIKKIGLYEYTVELFRENENEPWSTYNLLVDLEDEFDIVEVTNMEITQHWYYVTIYVYTEEIA